MFAVTTLEDVPPELTLIVLVRCGDVRFVHRTVTSRVIHGG
jgi:hypothetical protein